MKKIISMFVVLLIISLTVGIVNVYAADDGLSTIISGMEGSSDIAGQDSNIAGTINNVIGLIQLVGTGISVIVVTMLGIKYLIASPSEKADTKKMIMPILTGCILLFGAVNIVAIIAEFSAVLG